MKRINRSATALFFVVLLVCGTLAWGQASVNESLETNTVYVDAVKGSDSNPGTKQLPFKTIAFAVGVAVSNNQSSVGTKVIVNPGTYREALTMDYSYKDTTLPITIQAATTGQAILSGADVFSGWHAYTGRANVYTNSWPNQWGLCALDSGTGTPPPEEDIVRRREMVIVNGTNMSQVMALGAMRVGTFYVDETKGTIYLWPPDGTNMSTATVEVPSRASLLEVSGKSNLVFRGLTFQYANSCRVDSAVTIHNGSSNVLIDQDFFSWNNSTGLKLQGTTYTTVQNVVANHNGSSGVKGFTTKYDVWQNTTANFNGWRGAQGVYYYWGSAGVHFDRAHEQTLTNVNSSWNQTFGFHWDTDAYLVTADALVASQNQLAGGFVEQSEGPVTITNSAFCNGNPSMGPNNNGFEIRNSENVTLTGSTLQSNLVELMLIGTAGGVTISNWETGQTYNLISQNTIFSNNQISGSSTDQLFQDGALNGSDWNTFVNTLTSDYNTWWNSSSNKTYIVPVPNTWTLTDFPGWQSTTGKDANSAFKTVANDSACNVAVDKPDFWFTMNAFDGYQTVTAGGTATFASIVTPLNFTGTVTLASDGVGKIPGATASFSPSSISTSGTSTFTVTTSKTTPKGAYNVTLLATNGSTTRTMTVTVTVQ
jgi:hypothetical protein